LNYTRLKPFLPTPHDDMNQAERVNQ